MSQFVNLPGSKIFPSPTTPAPTTPATPDHQAPKSPAMTDGLGQPMTPATPDHQAPSRSSRRRSSSRKTTPTPTPAPTPEPAPVVQTAPTGEQYYDDPRAQQSRLTYVPGLVTNTTLTGVYASDKATGGFTHSSGRSYSADYSGRFYPLPGESEQEFEKRVQATVKAKARSEAERLAKDNPGVEYSVGLNYSYEYKQRPEVRNLPNQKDPQTIRTNELKKSPEFVVNIPQKKPEFKRTDVLTASEFGSYGAKGNIVVGEAKPADIKIKGWTPQIIKGIDKALPERGKSNKTFESRNLLVNQPYRYPNPGELEKGTNLRAMAIYERFRRTSGLELIDTGLEKAKTFLRTPAPGTEGVTYSRGGEFVFTASIEAVQDITRDPVKYGVLYGATAGATKVGSYSYGVLKGIPQVARVIENPLAKKIGTGAIYSAGTIVVGAGVVDIATSDNPSQRAGVILAESLAITGGIKSVNYKASFEAGRRKTQGFFFKGKPSDVVKVDYKPFDNFVVVKPGQRGFVLADEGAKGFVQRSTQRDVFGGLVSETDLARSVVMQSRTSPMGLQPGVTFTRANMPNLEGARFDVPEFRGFRYITETGSGRGVELDPFKFGTRTKSLPEFGIDQARVTLIDVKNRNIISVTPRGYEQLMMTDPARFRMSKIFTPTDARSVVAPRQGGGVSEVQTSLKSFDVVEFKPEFKPVSSKNLLEGKMFSFAVPVTELQGLSQSFNVGATRLSSASSQFVQSQVVGKSVSNFAVLSPSSLFKQRDASLIPTSFNVGVSLVKTKTLSNDAILEKEGKLKTATATAFASLESLGRGKEAVAESSLSLIHPPATITQSKGRSRLRTETVTELVTDTITIPVIDTPPPPIREDSWFRPGRGGSRPVPPSIPVTFFSGSIPRSFSAPKISAPGFSRLRPVKTAFASKGFIIAPNRKTPGKVLGLRKGRTVEVKKSKKGLFEDDFLGGWFK
jgi:hypothetical protein